jgi:hypothetical protein
MFHVEHLEDRPTIVSAAHRRIRAQCFFSAATLPTKCSTWNIPETSTQSMEAESLFDSHHKLLSNYSPIRCAAILRESKVRLSTCY